MDFINGIFLFFIWLVVLRKILFWLYLWQLKEYHISRFLAHFSTENGRKILFDKISFLKIFCLFSLFYIVVKLGSFPYDTSGGRVFPWIISAIFFFFVLFLVYAAQAAKSIKDFFIGRIAMPVFTLKVILLFIVSLMISGMIYYLWGARDDAIPTLVLLDLAIPLWVSAIVLIFQPFFVLARNRILQKAKEKILRHKNLIVIGITGSYGKTSTKEFLKTILSVRFKVLATPDHKNSEIGIARTIINNLNENHQIFIVEMGAYNKGGIKLLCDITRPKIGIVTGVNEQHLATFGSMDNLLSAEGGQELLDSLPKDGLIVVNGNNKYCLDLYKKTQNHGQFYGSAAIYSVNKDKIDSNIWTEEISLKKDLLDFVVMTKDREAVHFNAGILGLHNIQNLLAAILVAKELGMSLEEIARAAKNIKQEQAGITLKTDVHGIQIIDSSYSSNPDGVMADLDYLNIFGGKKVIVMPCLIELGKKSAQIHLQIGKKIAEICDLAIITTKDNFEEIKNGAVARGMEDKKIIFSEKPKEIFNFLTTFCKAGDAVLLEGRVPLEAVKLLA